MVSSENEKLIVGLNGIAIYVTDLARAKEFYTKILGLKEMSEVPGGVFLDAGGETIYLEGGRKKQSNPGLEITTISPAFKVESVKSAFNFFSEKNIEIIQEYVEYAPTFAMFRIADPDKNVLEFAGKP